MGMFDQNGKKKLIIVHTDDTAKYANYLQLMLSVSDDLENEVIGVKDGTVETVVWTEKEYFAQKPQLSGDSYILFVGTSKKLEVEYFGMQERFNQYGMKYSWLGKRANLCVFDSISRKKYDSFLDYAKKYQTDVERAMDTKKETIAKDAAAAGVGIAAEAASVGAGVAAASGTALLLPFSLAVFAPVGAVAGGIFAGRKIVHGIKEAKKVNEQQYCCLLLKFYMDGIGKFLAQ